MRAVVNEIVEGFLKDTSYFLIEIIEKADSLKIVLDGFNGISIRQCSRLARMINREAEENYPELGDYQIEVTSAGVGAKLVNDEQIKTNVGRLIKVTTEDNNKTAMKLAAFNGDELTLLDQNKKFNILKKEQIKHLVVDVEF